MGLILLRFDIDFIESRCSSSSSHTFAAFRSVCSWKRYFEHMERGNWGWLWFTTNIDHRYPREWAIFVCISELASDRFWRGFHRFFSVGVATAFGIVTRLDRLMVATKELVGESFHIHGIHGRYRSGGINSANSPLLGPESAAKQV